MAEQEWRPLAEDEAIRRADQKYLEAEQAGEWSVWNGGGTPPWWAAGCEWVETAILHFGERVILAELLFNDSLRRRLYGEIRKQASAFYDRKLWHYDSPLGNPTKKRAFVNWVVRRMGPTLATFDLEVLACTAPYVSVNAPIDGHHKVGDLTTAAERRAAVDALLERACVLFTGRPSRTQIWKLAGHKTARQFERWQAADSRATRADATNFRRIVKLPPEGFLSELRKKRLIG
jgi:hypothetical protein